MNCANCEHCMKSRGDLATRYSYHCSHPNKKYIRDYFRANRLNSMPGFLGFSRAANDLELARKTAPRWCPLKIEECKPGQKPGE